MRSNEPGAPKEEQGDTKKTVPPGEEIHEGLGEAKSSLQQEWEMPEFVTGGWGGPSQGNTKNTQNLVDTEAPEGGGE